MADGIIFKSEEQFKVDAYTGEVFPDYDHWSEFAPGFILQHPHEGNTWFRKARRLRRHPTIALARAILAAPLIRNAWVIEGEDEKTKELLERTLLPLRTQIMRSAVYSTVDYGFQVFETIPWKYQSRPETFLRFKPLNPDLTRIFVNRDGSPAGVLNDGYRNLNPTSISAENLAFCATNDEFNNPYGRPLLKNIEHIDKKYRKVEAGAERYVERTAGTHWVLWYPVGKTSYNGVESSNDEIANTVLAQLQSSGSIAMPVSESSLQDLLQGGGGSSGKSNKSAWDLQLITSQGGLDPFLEREKYLDTLYMRGLLLPERMALEGQFGTKAESSSHADVALQAIDEFGQNIVDWHNSEYGFVARILQYNNVEYYPGRAAIKRLPLSDDDKVFMREIFRTIVNNLKAYSAVIDISELGERADIPIAANAKEMLRKAEENALLSGSDN